MTKPDESTGQSRLNCGSRQDRQSYMRGACAALLLLTAVALVYQAAHLGLTADEPALFAASHQYWLGNDTLRPSDTPPLMRIVSGWVPVLMHAPVNRECDAWRARDAYGVGCWTLNLMDPARSRRVLFFTRLPFLIFPLGIVFLVWHWARRLWNEWIALVLAACAALEPTILGHGALIKSDVPAAFGALLFAWAAWRYWTRPRLRPLLGMMGALVVAVLAKFTLLPLVLLAMLLVLIKGPRAAAILIPVAVYVAILAAYQFRAGPIGQEELNDFRPAGIPAAGPVMALLPWPKQFVRGVLFVAGILHNREFSGYMLGHRITGPEPGYIPMAWAIKFPIPLQVLLLAGLAALLVRIRRREAGAADAFIWGFAGWYFVTAIFSVVYIGFRYVLPALPFFILAGGFALERWATTRAARGVVAALLLWLAVSSLRVYPQGISYFNEWIGGPENGWRYLADSNIDWGQNLPDLAGWVARHPGRRIRIYPFGLDEAGRYMPEDQWETPPWPANPGGPLPRRLQPAPGLYAISVNLLVGIPFARGYEDYLAWFRDRAPIGRAGYSILIYDVE